MYLNNRTASDTRAYYTVGVILYKYYSIVIITEGWSQRIFCTLAFDDNSSAVHVKSKRLVVSTEKWNAASEVYVEDVFTSFGKYCRGMSQHELQD